MEMVMGCGELSPCSSFSKNSKCEHLSSSHRLFSRSAVSEDTRQLRHFSQPATVLFSVVLNSEIHAQPLRGRLLDAIYHAGLSPQAAQCHGLRQCRASRRRG